MQSQHHINHAELDVQQQAGPDSSAAHNETRIDSRHALLQRCCAVVLSSNITVLQ